MATTMRCGATRYVRHLGEVRDGVMDDGRSERFHAARIETHLEDPMTLRLTSDSFRDGEHLAAQHELSDAFGFGCSGGNISPPLSWTGAPEATRSFAITCFDPDAPTGCGFWHWIVVNLRPDVRSLPAGAGAGVGTGLPNGALQVRTDFGTPVYGGPCPPPGDQPHRYRFTVHAVDVDALPVEESTSGAVVGFQLHAHTLESATLVGLAERSAVTV